MAWEPQEDARPPVDNPPAGYAHLKVLDPFEAQLAPFYRHKDDVAGSGTARICYRIDDRHVTGPKTEDGRLATPGALMTFADATLGWAAWDGTPIATIRLNAEITKRPPEGAWVFAKTKVAARDEDSLTITGVFTDEAGAILMNVSSRWKIVG